MATKKLDSLVFSTTKTKDEIVRATVTTLNAREQRDAGNKYIAQTSHVHKNGENAGKQYFVISDTLTTEKGLDSNLIDINVGLSAEQVQALIAQAQLNGANVDQEALRNLIAQELAKNPTTGITEQRVQELITQNIITIDDTTANATKVFSSQKVEELLTPKLEENQVKALITEELAKHPSGPTIDESRIQQLIVNEIANSDTILSVEEIKTLITTEVSKAIGKNPVGGGQTQIPIDETTSIQIDNVSKGPMLPVLAREGEYYKNTAKNTYKFTVLEADELESAWKKAQGSTTKLNFSNDSSADSKKRAAWWGIPATLYSSKTSWYIKINENGKMNASTGTNDVKIRVCGVGENGKVGLWSDAYSIHIDSRVPRYSESPLLYQYSSELSDGDAFHNAEPTSSQAYSSGIYLKGQWYLCTSVTDETKVKINGVSRGSTSLTCGTDYFVWPSTADNSNKNAAGSDKTDSGRYIAYVYIKIDTANSSTQNYTITAEDSDKSGNNNTSTATFEVNADNVAPVFSLNSSGKPVVTDGNDSEISMTKLKNSDHVVTFGSTATDTGSGFERIAFYFVRTFVRTVGSEKTVELPIPLNNGSAWENSSSAAYVGKITSSGGLETDKDLKDSVDTNYSGLTVDSDLNDAQEENYSANALY